jgi:heme/copper-type cytochrome/quinol oxidase subunit 1
LFTLPSSAKETFAMPILLWFLGVPVVIIVLLMLFGVVSF